MKPSPWLWRTWLIFWYCEFIHVVLNMFYSGENTWVLFCAAAKWLGRSLDLSMFFLEITCHSSSVYSKVNYLHSVQTFWVYSFSCMVSFFFFFFSILVWSTNQPALSVHISRCYFLNAFLIVFLKHQVVSSHDYFSGSSAKILCRSLICSLVLTLER